MFSEHPRPDRDVEEEYFPGLISFRVTFYVQGLSRYVPLINHRRTWVPTGSRKTIQRVFGWSVLESPLVGSVVPEDRSHCSRTRNRYRPSLRH